MNILDFFCEEKACDDYLQELKQEYFNELKSSLAGCGDCEAIYIQKKYLHGLYYIMKNSNNKDK